ncbi:hypothetical protein [Hydrogenophaga sp. R2]|uniref:hypothetical protein n=1 Tax=Hydrogenophaga sp. R2 TaxID=3132827 RepID=UPI003CEC4048
MNHLLTDPELRGGIEDSAALRRAIDALFDDEAWDQALPLTLQLMALEPQDPSASYRLGSCLQRMEQFEPALAAFTLCLLAQGDQPTPGPLLRTGECLAAVGQRERARELLHASVDAARSDPQYAPLQALAQQQLDALMQVH